MEGGRSMEIGHTGRESFSKTDDKVDAAQWLSCHGDEQGLFCPGQF